MRGRFIVEPRRSPVVGARIDSPSNPGLTTARTRGDSVAFMRRPRLRRFDLLLPSLIALVGAVEVVVAGYQPWCLACGLFLLGAGVLSLARIMPLVVPVVVAVIYASTPLFGFDMSQPVSWVPLIAIACFSAGLHRMRRLRLAGLASVLVALAILMAGMHWLTDFEPNLLFGLIMSAGSWALGLGLCEALEQNRRTGAQAERARIEKALAVERATYAERERIAVELPDVLAHSLGVMVLQSSAAGDLIRHEPESAARALHSVAQAGREALVETGRLLRLLRDDRDELGLRPDNPDNVAAGDAGTSAPTRGTGRVRRADVLLPVAFGVVATMEMVSVGFRPLGASLGAYWLAVGLLCLRRAFPLAMPIGVFAVAVAAPVLGANTNDPASWIFIDALACFSAGRHVSRSRAVVGLASVAAAAGLVVLVSAARGALSADLVFVIPFALAPWAVGFAWRETLDRTRALAAGAERARLEQELETERAAAAERKRIARELHDVLANSLNVMIVQASLAADLTLEDPDAAAGAVSVVEQSGRAALGETGRLLRLIHGTDEVATHPQHGIADIASLTEEYAHAGLGITLDMDSGGRLPVGVDLSVYHVVREALTNVLKHAPGSPVHVRLARTRSQIGIEVRNGPTPKDRLATVPSGHGLTGLRERVSVFGGSLDARPTVDGGFLLIATMPIPEAV
jgi:signal transduction histidine kinase